jgi:rod shape-determining protein MreC
VERNHDSGLRSLTRRDPLLLILFLTAAGLLSTLSHDQQLAVSAILRSTVLAPAFWVQERTAELRLTRYRVDRLRAERDSLALRLLRYRGVIEENARLRELAGLLPRVRSDLVPANLYPVGRKSEEIKHSFILDLGTERGIQTDAAVVSPAGLVGVVRAVEADEAAGDFWTHPDFRVSVMTVDGKVFGIVRSIPGTPPRMRLEGAPYQADLEPGTEVVTSGLGGIFPRGIPVGHVVSLLSAEVGWAKNYLLEPAVYPDAAREVLVVVDSTAVGGDLNEVWRPEPSPGEQR